MTEQNQSQANQLVDGDYELTEGRAWLGVGKFSIRVAQTDEGVVVDIYQRGMEDQSSIAGTWAHVNDLAEEETPTEPQVEPQAETEGEGA